jgi:hypothetical protein
MTLNDLLVIWTAKDATLPSQSDEGEIAFGKWNWLNLHATK